MSDFGNGYRNLASFLCIFALAAFLASPASGQDQVVTLKGEVIKGKIVDDDGHRVQIKPEGDGAMITLSYTKLSVDTLYVLKAAKVQKDNGFSQLDFANWCRDHGLFDDARHHYQAAVDAKADLEPIVKEQMGLLRVYAVRDLMKEARELQGKGDMVGAEKIIVRVVKEFPNEREADAARVMLEHIARSPKAKGSPAVLNAQIMGIETHRQYEKASHHLDAATHMIQRGLAATKYQSQAIHFFEQAISEAGHGLKEAQQIDKKAVQHSEVSAEIEKLEQGLGEQIIQAHLHTADMWFMASSFNKANEEAQKVLAIDPDNAEAKNLQTRIQDAKADGGTWGWGEGSGRWAGHRRGGARRGGRGRR